MSNVRPAAVAASLHGAVPLSDGDVAPFPARTVRGQERRQRRRRSVALWRAFRHSVEYLCLLAAATVAASLPRRVWLWCGARLGDALYVLRCRRRTVLINMDLVGLWPAAQQRRIMRQLYRNTGRYAADFLRPSVPPPAVLQVSGDDKAVCEALLHRGGIVLFAHLGNWEVLPALLRGSGRTITVIAKPMANPLVERWLQRKRQAIGVSFIAPGSALRQCLRVVRDQGLIAMAIDQYPGRRGTPSVFLGHLTRTVRSSAGLTVHTGCPVTGVYALLGDDGAYRVAVEAVPSPGSAAVPGVDSVTEVQQAHNTAVSAWVRAHPEHWFGWFHRRFKDVVTY